MLHCEQTDRAHNMMCMQQILLHYLRPGQPDLLRQFDKLGVKKPNKISKPTGRDLLERCLSARSLSRMRRRGLLAIAAITDDERRWSYRDNRLPDLAFVAAFTTCLLLDLTVTLL